VQASVGLDNLAFALLCADANSMATKTVAWDVILIFVYNNQLVLRTYSFALLQVRRQALMRAVLPLCQKI
jgi:hypothetical protein